MREAGLEVTRDPGGNLVGQLEGSEPELPEVWSGSHLDTPPDGGRFDGALGVLSALDAAEAIAADGPPRRGITVIAFRLEEGPRFGRGVFGSRAICGMLDDDEGDLRDADGVSLAEAFRALGLGELPTSGWLDPPPVVLPRAAHRAGPDARCRRPAARHRRLDRRHGGSRAHVLGSARPRRHGADAAALRCARRRGSLRRRRPRRRPLAARRRGHDRPADGRARRDEHDPRALRAVRRPARARRRARRGPRERRRGGGARGGGLGELRGRDRAALALRGGRHEPGPEGRADARRRGARRRARPSSPPAPATTRRSWRSPACRARCSSCAATRAA